ncbi:MAG: archaeosine synthase subunit alpha [Methanoregulaceae archaeon]|nr:archaeosine synthase subunit alpha [Methanoregulaceae archaeon]
MRYDIRARDCLARSGTFTAGDLTCRLPGVIETDQVFPDLKKRRHTNIPLSSDTEFAESWQFRADSPPVEVHPAVSPGAGHGDVVMIPCWHTALSHPAAYVRWLIALKERVPPDTIWYAPAAALPSTAHLLSYTGFDLFDFRAVELRSAQGIFCLPEGEFPAEMMETGACSCAGCATGDLRSHNRLALIREFALIRDFISRSRLRELVESRSRFVSEQVSILRLLDASYAFTEPRTPVVRRAPFGATTGEALRRVEVVRFRERVSRRFLPPAADVAVLLPCSARKPYSLSQSHRKFIQAIAGRAHELIITSPVGLVPRELERIYPAAHYDVPVTGYWDREEQGIIAAAIAEYFSHHPYRRVIAHLDGGALQVAQTAAEICGISIEVTCRDHPLNPVSLRSLEEALDGESPIRPDPVRGILSYQFGGQAETRGLEIRAKGPEMKVFLKGSQVFSLDPATGYLRPTFEGWNLIEGYRVDMGDLVPEGDVLAPGVLSAAHGIRDGDEVLAVGTGAIATGRAAMSGQEMEQYTRGVAVRVRKVRKL